MPNFLNLRTKVLKMIKTSVLILLSGLFDRSRSRTVTALIVDHLSGLQCT